MNNIQSGRMASPLPNLKTKIHPSREFEKFLEEKVNDDDFHSYSKDGWALRFVGITSANEKIVIIGNAIIVLKMDEVVYLFDSEYRRLKVFRLDKNDTQSIREYFNNQKETFPGKIFAWKELKGRGYSGGHSHGFESLCENYAPIKGVLNINITYSGEFSGFYPGIFIVSEIEQITEDPGKMFMPA